jgi:hypothetical protein
MLFCQNKTKIILLPCCKDFFCTFAKPKRDTIMTKQYQKTSQQITDLMQQNAIKKRLFCVLKT